MKFTSNPLYPCLGLIAVLGGSLVGVANAQLQFPVGPPTPRIGEVARYRTIDLWNNKEQSTTEIELVEIQRDRLVTMLKISTAQ